MERIVFAVGTGRCGTKTLAKLFEQLPNVTSLHEPRPSLLRLAVFKQEQQAYPFEHALRKSRDHVNERLFYLESAMWGSWLIAELLNVWPQARFIWLFRDIHDFARSTHRRGWYHPEAMEHMGMFKRLLPQPPQGWPPNVDRWFKLGYCWGFVNHFISTSLRRHRASYRLLWTEDLNDLHEVNSLVRWCGFPGKVTKACKANKGNQRVTVLDLKRLGLYERFLALGYTEGKHLHSYAWKTVDQLRELGLPVDPLPAPPLTKAETMSLYNGLAHVDLG